MKKIREAPGAFEPLLEPLGIVSSLQPARTRFILDYEGVLECHVEGQKANEAPKQPLGAFKRLEKCEVSSAGEPWSRALSSVHKVLSKVREVSGSTFRRRGISKAFKAFKRLLKGLFKGF